MNANGRLTAPPELRAVLVTNSVFGNLLQGRLARPEARGNLLATPPFSTRPDVRHARKSGDARSERRFRKSDPVSAALLLSAITEAAAGS